jgi:hypothetical protein
VASDAEIATLLEFTQAVADLFTYDATDSLNSHIDSVAVNAPAVEHLDQHRVYTGVVVLTYAVHRAAIAPRAWLPSDLTGIRLVLDASLDKDDGLIVDAAAISEWKDRSGLAAHATQSDPAKRPIWAAAGMSTYPAASFTSDSLSISLVTPTAWSGFTAWCVQQFATLNFARFAQGLNNEKWCLQWGAVAGGKVGLTLEVYDTDGIVIAASKKRGSVTNTSAPRLWVVTWDGTTPTIYCDGVALTTVSGGTITTTANTLSATSGYYIASAGWTSGVLSAANLNYLGAWAAKRYGLTVAEVT